MDPTLTPVEFASYKRFKQMRVSVPVAELQSGTGSVEVVEWLSSRRKVTVSSDTGGTLVLRSFWFPGWVAQMDGERVPIRPSTELALQTIEVPAGRHTVELSFEQTPVRRASTWIGLVALIATPALGVILGRAGLEPTAAATRET